MTAVDDLRTFTFPPRSARGAAVLTPVEFTPRPAPRTGEVPVAPSTVVTPRVTPSLERRQTWERRHRTRLALTDSVVVLTATLAAGAAGTAFLGATLPSAGPWGALLIPLTTALTWMVMLGVFHTRDPQGAGAGATEYKRVAHASGWAFGVLAIAFAIFQWDGLRAQLLVALPVGLVALLLERRLWRRRLLRQRLRGHFLSRALVVGRPDDVEYVIRTLHREAHLGYSVVGASMDGVAAQGRIWVDGESIAVVGSLNTVAQAAGEVGADTIIVASLPEGEPDYIKHLSWQLEGTAAELILSSRLADVAGPRISLHQVEGLPLIHVKIPTFEGGKHLLKRVLDIAVAGLALIPIALITPFIALAITLDNPGTVFFRQERVGRDGRTFKMVKFRSMKVNAEAELAALMQENEGAGPLFKMKHDPRVTRVGRILRKLSLDELPQFWNVLVGDMSVVGPRPPLPSEVTAYDGTVFRRLYISPGITGLWQVSGRSDLTWEESVRLDLRYVENWSVMNDLMIMWRTARVMVSPRGAY
jgi:exopolysaccharide biosynthesis polyprenyl glycosylphosphotransferase